MAPHSGSLSPSLSSISFPFLFISPLYLLSLPLSHLSLSPSQGCKVWPLTQALTHSKLMSLSRHKQSAFIMSYQQNGGLSSAPPYAAAKIKRNEKGCVWTCGVGSRVKVYRPGEVHSSVQCTVHWLKLQGRGGGEGSTMWLDICLQNRRVYVKGSGCMWLVSGMKYPVVK